MTSRPSADPLVVFSPSGKKGRFAVGTPLLQAARSLGVDIDSVCGGHATCGRCQVGVTEGELGKLDIVSSAQSLSPPEAAETSYLTEHDCAGGRRLSCCASIQGDVAIDVPEESQIHRQVIRKPFEAHDIEIDPVVQCCYVEIPLPGIGQSRVLAENHRNAGR